MYYSIIVQDDLKQSLFVCFSFLWSTESLYSITQLPTSNASYQI